MAERDQLENQTFDEIEIGDQATLTRTLTADDITLFGVMSGDVNPSHFDAQFASETRYHKIVGHGMWGAALISSVVGTQLPGPGTIYLGQELRFRNPVEVGDAITVTLTVRSKIPGKNIVVLDCLLTNQRDERVITGTAEVIAPSTKAVMPRQQLPGVQLHRHEGYERLMAATKDLAPKRTLVVHPCDSVSLDGAVQAWRQGFIEPVLVGPEARIRQVADAEGIDLGNLEVLDAPHSHAAAGLAVQAVARGEGQMLMKGSLHTDELMREVTRSANGLRTERRISHAFVMDVPTYPGPLIVTDAAINIFPGLDDKRDITQNAIDLAHALGIQTPRVAILSAVETVTSKIPSTIDAAALCKMADRRQITGGILDGPLAMDNAISPAAAKTKQIDSQVAGRADILLAPDLEAANILAKQLSFLANADAAGIVLGARVPVILTSRADNLRSRMASCAVGVLLSEQGPPVK